MSWSPQGKNVLVTGSSSGIGAGLARRFAEAGATVGICGRREDRLAQVLEQCRRHSPGSKSWTVDLSDLDAVAAFARQADDELGGVDVLVNNAGIPKRRTVLALSPEEIEAVMRVNYLSPVLLTTTLLPRMLERGGGKIVNVSSVAARLSPPGEAAYAATKAALSAWSECMAVELWDEPVDVHVVYPGVIDTELFHLPDNDPSFAEVEALPVDTLVDGVVKMLETGAFEVWVPDWMGEVAEGKFGNVEGFLSGSAEYYRQQRAGA